MPGTLAAWRGVILALAAAPVEAQSPPDARPSGPTLGIELNRLAPASGGCELGLVLTNETAISHEELRAELVLFQADGLIGRRASADLGPVESGRTVVRTFLIPETDCTGIGRVLINDFTSCADAAKAQNGRCRPEIAVSSRTAADLVY